METAKFVALFFIIILAFVGVSASYAAWYDQTEVDVTATTGALSYKIQSIEVYGDPGDVDIIAAHVSGEGYKEWTATIDGAYPGWEGKVLITWENTGSIPLKFDSFRVIVDSGGALSPYYTLKFYYTPEGGDPWSETNVENTLQYFHSAGWISYGTIDVTIPPGATGESVVGLELSDTLEGHQEESIAFRVLHKVTQET